MPRVPHITRRLFALLFITGLVIRVAALPLRGTEDVRVFKAWAATALSHGLLSVYRVPDPPVAGFERPDYPPLSVVLLAGAAVTLERVWGPEPVGSRVFTAAVKLLPLAAGLAVFVAVWRLTAARTGDAGLAALAAFAFWLNPAFIVNAAILGYLDVLCWAPGLAALVFAAAGRVPAAALMAACAVMIKPQGVFFAIPVLAVALASPRVVVRATLTGATACAVIVAPFVWGSGLRAFIDAMTVNIFDDRLSGTALNAWWLVTVAMSAAANGWRMLQMPLHGLAESTYAAWLGFAPRPWTALVVAAVAGRIAWLLRPGGAWVDAPNEGDGRRLGLLAAGTALAIHVFCGFAVSVHENHLVYAVAMLGVTAALDRRYAWLFVAMSVLATANMGLFYGLGRDGPALSRTGLFIVVTAVLSLGNIALLVAHARLFAVARRAPAHAASRPRGPAAGR